MAKKAEINFLDEKETKDKVRKKRKYVRRKRAYVKRNDTTTPITIRVSTAWLTKQVIAHLR